MQAILIREKKPIHPYTHPPNLGNFHSISLLPWHLRCNGCANNVGMSQHGLLLQAMQLTLLACLHQLNELCELRFVGLTGAKLNPFRMWTKKQPSKVKSEAMLSISTSVSIYKWIYIYMSFPKNLAAYKTRLRLKAMALQSRNWMQHPAGQDDHPGLVVALREAVHSRWHQMPISCG